MVVGYGWELESRASSAGATRASRSIRRTTATLEDDWTDRYTTFLDPQGGAVPQANGDYFGRVEVRSYGIAAGRLLEGTSDGSRLEFGLTEAGRIQGGTNRVFRWLVERETDTHRQHDHLHVHLIPWRQNQNQKYLQENPLRPGRTALGQFPFRVLRL